MQKFSLILVAIITIWVALGAQVKPTITDSYNAESARNYSRALEIMQSLSGNNGQDEFYILRIAWLQYLMGNYNEALKDYQKSNSIFPTQDAQIGILNCLLAMSKWTDALAYADVILKQYPQNTTVMSKAAYAAYMKQDYKTTADYYLAIINITPWDMEARGYLVNNLYLSKDVTNAKKHYQKLVKYYPDSPIVKEYATILGQ
ncbi:MAG TPA: tetratricopeptide repeat protein [Candidatus Cloacimonadota bacterium]|jgi:tetratricopeptide (TPR) repeat protein|nr:tetratricopeptide repeat protein [Candidatus Cloacimonadota bacterium]